MISIKKAGVLTTIQDLGRYGYQKYGVIASGAMDCFAHRIANLLVGNAENSPTLEITLVGPTIVFHDDLLIAICGAALAPRINAKPLRLWRPILVKKGSVLEFGQLQKGCRAYVAIGGGFFVPEVMGSKSTYIRAGIGGFEGRPLEKGDRIQIGPPSKLSAKLTAHLSSRLTSDFVEEKWSVAFFGNAIYHNALQIRVMKGRQFHLFTNESQENFLNEAFAVTTQSDRMGYRLKGPALSLENNEEMISEAVSFGTIQVPADGNPIILLADRQTTGGYPKIGQVASVDLPLIAQAKPGDQLQFIEISHAEAQVLFLEREMQIKELSYGISQKYI